MLVEKLLGKDLIILGRNSEWTRTFVTVFGLPRKILPPDEKVETGTVEKFNSVGGGHGWREHQDVAGNKLEKFWVANR